MITYAKKERARYWPISPELMAQYNDGSHTKNQFGRLYWKNKNREWHRDLDKPTVIDADGGLEWCQNGLRHRDDDKPAFIGADGTLEWWQNGLQHRFSGPAVIWANNHLDWYINDENITCEVNAWLNGKRWRGTPLQIFEFQLRFG